VLLTYRVISLSLTHRVDSVDVGRVGARALLDRLQEVLSYRYVCKYDILEFLPKANREIVISGIWNFQPYILPNLAKVAVKYHFMLTCCLVKLPFIRLTKYSLHVS
jgi:hypothetical protein